MASIHLLHSPKTLTLPKFRSSFPSTMGIATRSLSFPKPKPKTITCAATPATDRLISAVSYTLPFFNSLQYGRYLFLQFPKLGLVFEPLLPLLGLYRSVPYSSFVAFFALYLGVVRNPSFSHYARFNAMQAVTLDVLLVLPLLIQRIFSPGQAGVGFKLMMWGHNGIFVFSVFCFVYGLVSSILGRTPYLPFVADAAGRQL
ncbi:protein TIC 20-II, chloroplastic [Argentina anserina]|uniref:protein TIC 20-II, chloroplastic n=1 Tax=Argentina anserina TaxID=57926 RepID=UPI0021764784|nr:protein TIC 20-II, chloroplastic [Potentilla anserina]